MDIGNLPDGGVVLDADQFVVSRGGTARRIQGVRLVRTDASGNALLSGDPIITAGKKLRIGNTPALGGDGGDTTFLYTGDDALVVRNAADSATLFRLSSTGAGAVTGTLNVTGALTQANNQVWHGGNFAPGNYAALAGAVFTGTVRAPNMSVSDGNRFINLVSADGAVYTRGDAGGWDIGYRFGGPTVTNLGGFGALGTNNTLSYWYVGASVGDANNLRLTPAGALTLGTRTIWHSGNLDPNAYAPKSSPTFTGVLTAPNITTNGALISAAGSNAAYVVYGNAIANYSTGIAAGIDAWRVRENQFAADALVVTRFGTSVPGSLNAGTTVAAGTAMTVGGFSVFHQGNFNPNNYAPLAGAAFSGTISSPRVQGFDTNFAMVNDGNGNPLLRVAPNTFYGFNRGGNYHDWFSDGASAMTLRTSGLNIVGSVAAGSGMTIGGFGVWHAGNLNPAVYAPLGGAAFTGGISAPTVQAGLANHYIGASGSVPLHVFDAGDAIQYDRANNKFGFVIGGTLVASIDAAGTLRVAGNVIGATAP